MKTAATKAAKRPTKRGRTRPTPMTATVMRQDEVITKPVKNPVDAIIANVFRQMMQNDLAFKSADPIVPAPRSFDSERPTAVGNALNKASAPPLVESISRLRDANMQINVIVSRLGEQSSQLTGVAFTPCAVPMGVSEDCGMLGDLARDVARTAVLAEELMDLINHLSIALAPK